MKTYRAEKLSATKDYDPSKRGFKTYDEAEKYIINYLCPSCDADLMNGYIEIEYINEKLEKVIDKILVNSSLDTFCGAEWMIIEEIE